ncbi:MAG: hypothetical protein ACOC44_13715 [Promethearchaeia archaeon]
MKKKIIKPAAKEYGKIFGNYWYGPTFSANKTIQKITDKYKLSVLKKFYSLSPYYINPINKENHYKNLPDDLIVSVKRDGSYYTYNYDEASEPLSIFCNSPNARAIYNLPVNRQLDDRIAELNNNLNRLKEPLKERIGENIFKESNKIKKIVIAGELFADVKKKNDRPRVFDLVRLLNKPKGKEDLQKIHYDIFDIISINDHDLQIIPYEIRLQICKLLFSEGDEGAFHIIEHQTEVKAGDVYKLYERWVKKQNHEGLVIHTKFNMVYKVKPIFKIDAVIIGFVELLKEKLIEDDKGAISSVLLALMHKDGTYQELCRIGGGFSYEQRVELFNLIKDDVVESSFRASKSDGRAYRFVKPKYVIQIKYMDFVTEGGSGKPIMRMNLDFKNNKWKPRKSVPFVSLTSPRYDVMRSQIDKDKYPTLEFENPKEVRYEDIRCEQILDLVSVDLKSAEIIEDLPESNVIFKVVFDSEWAGYRTPKKILFWETNKGQINSKYPNYVIYYANYNYLRKTPLKQEIYPFNTFEKAIDHINWIIKRPASDSKSLLNKSRTDLKRSIKSPPYDLYFEEEYKNKISKRLDPIVKNILLDKDIALETDMDLEKLEVDIDDMDIGLDEKSTDQEESKKDKDFLDKMLESDLDDIDFDDI